MEESSTMFEFNFVKKKKNLVVSEITQVRPRHNWDIGSKITVILKIFNSVFHIRLCQYIFRGNTVIKKHNNFLLQNAVTQEIGAKIDFFD